MQPTRAFEASTASETADHRSKVVTLAVQIIEVDLFSHLLGQSIHDSYSRKIHSTQRTQHTQHIATSGTTLGAEVEHTVETDSHGSTGGLLQSFYSSHSSSEDQT